MKLQDFSGQNLSIDDQDYPLIIKVASVSAARMQVYFIDNEEFLKENLSLLMKMVKNLKTMMKDQCSFVWSFRNS